MRFSLFYNVCRHVKDIFIVYDENIFQLEIFWRRSLFGDSGKIYCLVNADLLDYEVSDKGEKLLEKHMKNAQNRGNIF